MFVGEKQQRYYCEDKGIQTFFKSLRVNVIAQLEFEHVYFKAAVQYLSHYTSRTHPSYFDAFCIT